MSRVSFLTVQDVLEKDVSLFRYLSRRAPSEHHEAPVSPAYREQKGTVASGQRQVYLNLGGSGLFRGVLQFAHELVEGQKGRPLPVAIPEDLT